eukprot:TRINITY_DN6047_c0_g3_i1.p3 TRINITY_DN6047_c0_g3~~TRINITY_DN6047_c0_g3_i1.p3  ORF type:complete len:139 (-),score=28.46 TRINITY_DN6047_c0_g3_i1:466-882(-)
MCIRDSPKTPLVFDTMHRINLVTDRIAWLHLAQLDETEMELFRLFDLLSALCSAGAISVNTDDCLFRFPSSPDPKPENSEGTRESTGVSKTCMSLFCLDIELILAKSRRESSWGDRLGSLGGMRGMGCLESSKKLSRE